MAVSASSARKNPTATYRPNDPPPIPSRRPLTPSEKDNAGASRRLKTKDIASRYLSSYSPSSSTTSTSYSSNTTTSTSSSSSSSRRFHSPGKRSQSVDRTRPDLGSNAARALCTTTRSLSVSFQGESFFYQTSKAKTPSPVASRKQTPERSRRPGTPGRNSNAEKPSPSDFHQRWPAARSRRSGLLTKSLECGAERNEFLSTVQLLRQSSLFDGAEQSDRDSVSSGSNSGTPEINAAPRQGRFRELSEPGTPRNSVVPKLGSLRRALVDSPSLISRSGSSQMKGLVRPSSPSRVVGSLFRVMASPSRANVTANAPSILSFAAEVRRSRKGENRIEEAHLLRLLHNKHLQWRCVNARSIAIMMVQRMDVEVRFVSCVTLLAFAFWV